MSRPENTTAVMPLPMSAVLEASVALDTPDDPVGASSCLALRRSAPEVEREPREA